MNNYLIEKYLGEGSVKAEAQKALSRFKQFAGNETKIRTRIKRMTKPLKILLFGLTLEYNGYHDIVELCAAKYREVTGKNMYDDPMWAKGIYDLV